MAERRGSSWVHVGGLLGGIAAMVTAIIGVVTYLDDSDGSETTTGDTVQVPGGGGGEAPNGGEVTVPPTPGGETGETGETGGAEEAEGCVIEVDHIGADIKEDPSHDARHIASVPSGDYPALDFTIANWAGLDQGWFLIDVEGRQGWIVDDSILITDKSADCP